MEKGPCWLSEPESSWPSKDKIVSTPVEGKRPDLVAVIQIEELPNISKLIDISCYLINC